MTDEQAKSKDGAVDAKFTVKMPQGAGVRAEGNAEREQEDFEEQMAHVNQYELTGAMNYPVALGIATHHFKQLRKDAQEDVVLAVVTRGGAVQWFGTGEVFDNNDETPSEGGFLVYIEDIEEEIAEQKKNPEVEEM